jgi:hypothetical protein
VKAPGADWYAVLLLRPCPTCNADPGEPCTMITGITDKPGAYHISRLPPHW